MKWNIKALNLNGDGLDFFISFSQNISLELNQTHTNENTIASFILVDILNLEMKIRSETDES